MGHTMSSAKKQKRKKKVKRKTSPKQIFLLRLASSFVLGPMLLALSMLPTRWPILLLAIVCFSYALREVYGLLAKAGSEPYQGLGISAGALMLVLVALPQVSHEALIGLSIFVIAFVLFLPILRGGRIMEAARAGATLLGLLYIVGFSSFFVVLAKSSEGREMIPALLVLCWVFDSAAMGAGSFWGKHKLSKASPNKSWEGVGGGFVGALVAVFVLRSFGIWDSHSAAVCVGAGLVLGVAAVMGDLVGSALKREAGVSDSGRLLMLPGHGGILDKLDSILFAGPFLWLYFHWITSCIP